MASSPPNHQKQQSHDQSNKSIPLQSQSTTLVLTTPFSNFFKPNTNTTTLFHNLHNSFVSSKHHFFSFFNSFISHNPLLSSLSSLSSHLHQTSHQIQNGRVRNVNLLGSKNFAAILPGDSVAGIVVTNGIMNFLNLYNTVLVVRLVLTWFPNTPPAIVTPLSTLCDPYLNIFRGIIPPLGGTLDLSPILAFLVLNAFTSAAAALPCELPPPGGREGNLPSPKGLTYVTTSQKLWMRRLCRNQPKSSEDAN